MMKAGLNKEQILAKSIELIEQRGAAGISMHELAEALGVKTPSLYNHITGIEELELAIARYSGDALRNALTGAVTGRQKDDAVTALAAAYRKFGKEHPGMYDTVMSLPKTGKSEFSEIIRIAIRPIVQTIREYNLSDEQTVHWQRVLRSIMHGFISQEKSGFFKHFDISADDSYQVAINCYLTGLHDAAGREAKQDIILCL